MKVENIEYFLTVAEIGSINKAAEKLFLTQQSLGLIIRRMESEMNVSLFIRTFYTYRKRCEIE